MKEMFPEHLSFLVRDSSTGEIIGAAIAGDLYLQEKRKHSCDTPGLSDTRPSRDLIEELNDLFVSRDFGQELRGDQVLHIQLSAVRAQHSVKGVLSKVRERELMLNNARDKGLICTFSCHRGTEFCL